MSKFEGVAYEPHPVSPERKAELRAKGLKIIDARFKPADVAGEKQGDEQDGGKTGDTGMTAAKLKEELTARGIEFKGNASKAALQELYDQAVAGEKQGGTSDQTGTGGA